MHYKLYNMLYKFLSCDGLWLGGGGATLNNIHLYNFVSCDYSR